MLLWKIVSEQGVKTRSREGVGVTDAGKGSILLRVSCFGWEGTQGTDAGKVGSAGIYVFLSFGISINILKVQGIRNSDHQPGQHGRACHRQPSP